MSFAPSARQVLALMVFWGQIQNYMMRVNLSILIVAMVEDTQMIDNNSTEMQLNLTCMENRVDSFNQSQVKDLDHHPGFDWDELRRGQVLGAFSIGYITTQIIGGRMTERFGVRRVFGLGLFFCGLLCCLSPIAAKLNVWTFMALRMVQGACEGVTFPALQAMTARWIPLKERSSFIARTYFGTVFGLVITFPLCGYVTDLYGWEAAFYIIGGITSVWFVFWWFLVHDSPDKHPRISAEELASIKMALGKSLDEKPMPVPWRAILTSIPVWGMIIGDCGNCWGIVTLGSNGPTYLKYVLGLDIKTNGLLSGLPMLCRYIGGVLMALLSDYLIHKEFLSVTNVRRVFNSICSFGPAVVMLLLAFRPAQYECDVIFVIVTLCVAMFLNGAMSSGHFAAPGDLSPNYAGTIMGISNTISGSGLGFAVPVFIGAITNNNQTFEAWTVVFGTAAAWYIVGNIFYVGMISGDIQPWNYQVESKELEESRHFINGPPKAIPEDTDI